jgi:hypothetical protein
MDRLQFVAERGEERVEIIGGGGPGCYVFRYLRGRNTHDYWQGDVPMAQQCAEAGWGCPLSAWRVASPGAIPLWHCSS